MALTNSSSTAKTTAKAAASTLNLTDGQIVVKVGTVTDGTCAVAATATTPDVTVTISYPMTYLTGFFGTSLTLRGKAVMRCNG